MLSDSNAFGVFSEDKISFSKEYWAQILKAYLADDRHYLGKYNALFLILRTNLWVIAQLRLIRVQTQPKLVTIEERIENIFTLLNSPAQREPLENLIKTLHERVNNAVIDACSGSGDSWPDYGEEDDSQEDPRFPRAPQKPTNPSDILNSTPYCSHHIDFTLFKNI